MKNSSLFLMLCLALGGCTTHKVAAPEEVFPVPSPKQVEWQKMETYAFIHFGLNSFTDREWGYGDISPEKFNPTKLDCEQWAKTFVSCGMKGVILTVKHHDGFCLWPSKETKYSIANSPYKNGKGDIVKELSAACKKYGLKLGIYLSPWDRNHAQYGTEEYLKYYYAQLNDLLTNYGDIFEVWFDGANGGDGWYGGKEGTRTIDRKKYYNFPYIHKIVEELQPNAIIFSDAGPGCRWVGNERGFAGETNWSFLVEGKVFPGYNHAEELTVGHADGNQWVPAECDVSIRPGWFYHPEEDKLVKTPEQLVDLYYRSVGRNGSLLLNFPVDREGLIHPTDSANAVEFYKIIQDDFKHNLVKGMIPQVSDERGGEFIASALTDDSYDTYWATPDSINTAEIIFKFNEPQEINRLMLQEYIPKGQRVAKFAVETKQRNEWKAINCPEETSTIGYKRLLRFETVTTAEVRIRILESRGPICLSNVGLFKAEELIKKEKSEDYESLKFTVVDVSPSDLEYITDKRENTTGALGWNQIIIDLGEPKEVSLLSLLPDQSSLKKGFIANYELWGGNSLDGLDKMITKGEFSNIQNNPVLQTIRFKSVKVRYIKLKATRMVIPDDEIHIAELVVR